MAELTIQISDELAQRLKPLQGQLPELLAQLVDTTTPKVSHTDLLSTISPINTPLVYAEVLDFLVTRPTPEQIVTFKASPEAQARLHALLDKNREATLSEAESAELDAYEQLEHLIILLKARAHNIIGK